MCRVTTLKMQMFWIGPLSRVTEKILFLPCPWWGQEHETTAKVMTIENEESRDFWGGEGFEPVRHDGIHGYRLPGATLSERHRNRWGNTQHRDTDRYYEIEIKSEGHFPPEPSRKRHGNKNVRRYHVSISTAETTAVKRHWSFFTVDASCSSSTSTALQRAIIGLDWPIVWGVRISCICIYNRRATNGLRFSLCVWCTSDSNPVVWSSLQCVVHLHWQTVTHCFYGFLDDRVRHWSSF